MIRLNNGVEIGNGQRPFIIAEVGSNWTSLEDCLFSIRAAKSCNADAVKFQLFTHEDLFGEQKSDTNTKELPRQWIPALADECKNQDIEFMCSAFSPDALNFLNPFVNIHKIASAEMTHVRLLDAAKDSGKPVILSTGAHNLQDIHRSVKLLNPDKTIVMYCIASYPARQTFLESINILRDELNLPVGYSDHSQDSITIPRMAIGHGAVVLEKHVNFVGCTSPDSPHSLSLTEFKEMIKYLEKPRNEFHYNKEEEPMILQHNRRLIATSNLKAGDKLIEGVNFGIYRSKERDTKALSAFFIDEVNGKLLKNSLKAFEGIGPFDIEIGDTNG